ncbi:hypothetical protein [Nonlabens sp.]|uniref:hypothetical protein n=1 Tax=Nonlabens sp. TaxID=1888209 RepID=UPI003F69F69B
MYKTSLFILLFIISASCKTKTEVTRKSTDSISCPIDGKCSFDVLKNKEVQIMKDKFNHTYHQINQADGKLVLLFKYQRNDNSRLVDDAYSESIFIQIDKSTTNLDLKDENLKNAKVSFTRMCFCRGATGTYPVKKGRLQLFKSNEKYHLKLDFVIDETPQVITSIQETFKI